jgi:protein-tyrosine phosphatase
MDAKTSEDSPIRVEFLHPKSVSGRIGMTFAPGKHQPAGMTAAWRRDLDLDLTRLREDLGTDVLVCLLESHELERLKIEGLPAATWHHGMAFWHFPIADMRAPRSPEATARLVEQIHRAIRNGETVVIHCMGGLGRTGTIAAACLVGLGEEPAAAIAQVRQARPGTIENTDQEAFVAAFKDEWHKLQKRRSAATNRS